MSKTALVLCALLWASANAAAVENSRPAFHEEIRRSWDNIGQELRDLFYRWQSHFQWGGKREQQPWISMMLRNRERLGLSEDQVKKLEQLRSGFEKESIRIEAEIRIAEIDLATLLEASPLDMETIEAKIRAIERLRADLRLARIRTIERGREQLTGEQREKLKALGADQPLTRSDPRPQPLSHANRPGRFMAEQTSGRVGQMAIVRPR